MKTLLLLTFFLVLSQIAFSQDLIKSYPELDTATTDLRLLNYVDNYRYRSLTNAYVFKNNDDIRKYADSNKFSLPAGFAEFNDEQELWQL